MPGVIAFTVETDGRLPSGQSLEEAIQAVDAASGNGPAYYMINCAHPDHFGDALKAGESWVKRIRGLRANASRLSHERSEEHTSELQSLMRISYAVFCLNNKNKKQKIYTI